MRLQYTICSMANEHKGAGVCLYEELKCGAPYSGHLLCSLFVQVLNKRKRSKQSARKEAFNRTRDIHTLQDLYPPQQILYKGLPAFSCECQPL